MQKVATNASHYTVEDQQSSRPNLELPCFTKKKKYYKNKLLQLISEDLLDILLKYGVIAGGLAESVIRRRSKEHIAQDIGDIDVFVLGGKEEKVKELITKIIEYLEKEEWTVEKKNSQPVCKKKKYREEAVYQKEQITTYITNDEKQNKLIPISTLQVPSISDVSLNNTYFRLLPLDILVMLGKIIQNMEIQRECDINNNEERYYVVRSKSVVTIVIRGMKPIQIILSGCNTVEQLISSFDIDVIQCAIAKDEGTPNTYTSYATQYAAIAHKSKMIMYILDVSYNPYRLRARLEKQLRKGYKLPSMYSRIKDIPVKWYPVNKVIQDFAIEADEQHPKNERMFYDNAYCYLINEKKQKRPIINGIYVNSLEKLFSFPILCFTRRDYEGEKECEEEGKEHNETIKFLKLEGERVGEIDRKFVSRTIRVYKGKIISSF